MWFVNVAVVHIREFLEEKCKFRHEITVSIFIVCFMEMIWIGVTLLVDWDICNEPGWIVSKIPVYMSYSSFIKWHILIDFSNEQENYKSINSTPDLIIE